MADPLRMAAAAALRALTPPSGSRAAHPRTQRDGRVRTRGDTHLVRTAVGALRAAVEILLVERRDAHESPFGCGPALCSAPALGGTAIALTVSARSTDPVADARPEVMDLSTSTGCPITNAATPEMARQRPAARAVVAVAGVALPQATDHLRTQVLPTLRSLVLQSWGAAAEVASALTSVRAGIAPAAVRVAVVARPPAASLLALGRTVPLSEQRQGSTQDETTQEPGHATARLTGTQRPRERIEA